MASKVVDLDCVLNSNVLQRVIFERLPIVGRVEQIELIVEECSKLNLAGDSLLVLIKHNWVTPKVFGSELSWVASEFLSSLFAA